MSKQNNKICNKIKKLLIKRIIRVKKLINKNRNNIKIKINQKIKIRKYE
jgi:hypothetical protein